MYKYVIKRILLMIPILLGITLIVFFIMSLTPGDPGRMILGQGATQEAVDKLNDEFGFYDPLPLKFGNYIIDILKGDFGVSYRTQRPVFDDLMVRLPTTLKLVILSLLIGTIIGIPIGILSAVKQYSALDVFSTFFALLIASIPTFWLGFMLIILFSLNLEILPSTGLESWKGYIMPVGIMAIGQAASLIRLTRSSMLEVIRQDYIRTARAKGVYEKIIVFKHSLRNALIPIVTVVGMSFARGLGGTLIIEKVFAIQGVGTFMFDAIGTKDIPVVMAGVIFLAAIFSLCNLIVDLLYGYLDPRIKAQYSK